VALWDWRPERFKPWHLTPGCWETPAGLLPTRRGRPPAVPMLHPQTRAPSLRSPLDVCPWRTIRDVDQDLTLSRQVTGVDISARVLMLGDVPRSVAMRLCARREGSCS
jgi:hypothetical protein